MSDNFCQQVTKFVSNSAKSGRFRAQNRLARNVLYIKLTQPHTNGV